MIRRRAFTSRLAAALALPACSPRVHSPKPPTPTGEPLWYDPFPHTEHMNVAAVLRQAPQAFTEARNQPTVVADVELAWTTPLPSTPVRVAAGAWGVAACGEATCHLVGASGERAGETPWADRGVVFDERGDDLLVGSDGGGSAVFRVPSGARRGQLGAWGNHEVDDLQRWGGFHLVVSLEPPPVHLSAPTRAGVQLLDVRTLRMRERRGEVEPIGVRRVGQLISPYTERVRVVATPHGLVLATEGGVQWTDWALRPGAVWRTTIQPEQLAADDDGFVGLIATRDRQRTLLLLDPSGELCAEVPLTSGDPRHAPPLLAGNGTFVLAPPGELIAYDRDGTIAWHFSREGSSPPVDLGKQGLVVEHTGQLWHCTWAGQARPFAKLPAPLTAAPATYGGAWYVASMAAVHRLSVSA